MLEYLTVETGENPDYIIIWLHGLGADGHDFESVVPEFKNDKHNFRFIFPHAPVQPVTINGGMAMRAWYDITSIDINRQVDEGGIANSVQLVRTLVDKQIAAGFNADQIVLAGFSQGGAMALHIALSEDIKFAAVVALSCYLPIPAALSADSPHANQKTPFFMAHGLQDPVVPYDLGVQSRQLLADENYQVSWHKYPIQHGVNMQELHDIKSFLQQLP